MTANDHAETDRLLSLLQETAAKPNLKPHVTPYPDIKDAVSIALHGADSILMPITNSKVQATPKHAEFDIARKTRFDQARLEKFLQNARSQQQHDRSERIRESEAYDWATNSAGVVSHRNSDHPLPKNYISAASRIKFPLSIPKPSMLFPLRSPSNEKQFLLWSSVGSEPGMDLSFQSLAREDPFDILKSLTPPELSLFEHQFPSLQAQQWRLVATTLDSSKKRVLVLSRNKPSKQNYARIFVLAASAGILAGVSLMGLEWSRTRNENIARSAHDPADINQTEIDES